MAIVMLQVADSLERDIKTPVQCPHCGSHDIVGWGTISREIHDIKMIQTQICRYYCNYCHSTFRYYPNGIDHSKYSERIRRLAALIWLMDLSVRDVIEVFHELGVELKRMAVWREGQKLVNELNSIKFLDPHHRFIIDKGGSINNRPEGNVLLVLRIDCKVAILGSLNTFDPYAVIAWLEPILNEMDVNIFQLGTGEFSY